MTEPPRHVLAAFPPAAMPPAPRAIRRINRLALGIAVALTLSVLGIAALPLSGAVIASGRLTVESRVKHIQHPTGGIVAEIHVRDGDAVAAGDVLLRLDDTLVRASLAVIQLQIDALAAREARLIAERDGLAAVAIPPALAARMGDHAVGQAITGERALFVSRRITRKAERDQLAARRLQFTEEAEGLERLIAARKREAELLAKEVGVYSGLYEKGLTTVQRVIGPQRDLARVEGDYGQLMTDLARVRSRAGEVEVDLAREDSRFQADVVDQLRDIQVRAAELGERRNAAEEQLSRIAVTAPEAGIVNGMSVHTIGGVIAAGQTILQIVPTTDDLIAELRLAPRDIDLVREGSRVDVRVLAGNTRLASPIAGEVVFVSADAGRDPVSGEMFYAAHVALDRAAAEHAAGVRLQSGMPADAYIATAERSVFDYLLQPLEEQLARAMRER